MNWRAKEGIRSESMDGLLQDITMNHSLCSLITPFSSFIISNKHSIKIHKHSILFYSIPLIPFPSIQSD